MILIKGGMKALVYNSDSVLPYRVYARTGHSFLQEVWHGRIMAKSLLEHFTTDELEKARLIRKICKT